MVIDLENPSWVIHEQSLFATSVEHTELCYVSHSWKLITSRKRTLKPDVPSHRVGRSVNKIKWIPNVYDQLTTPCTSMCWQYGLDQLQEYALDVGLGLTYPAIWLHSGPDGL